MANREKPTIKTVIETIEQHGGQMQTAELKAALGEMSETSIYRGCKDGIDEGYLTLQRVKRNSHETGRKQCVYVRTKKLYEAPKLAAKTLRTRDSKWRKKSLDEQSAEILPFRHWQDALLFGAYGKPYKPAAVTGRIYSKMREDDLEEAA